MDALLMVQKNLNSFNILLVYGMKKSILGLNLELQQQLNHLQVLVVYGHQKCSSTKWVNAVDVNTVSAALKHSRIRPTIENFESLGISQEVEKNTDKE